MEKDQSHFYSTIIYLGSSLSNSYLSDHEPTSPTMVKNSQYQPFRPATSSNTNFNNNRCK